MVGCGRRAAGRGPARGAAFRRGRSLPCGRRTRARRPVPRRVAGARLGRRVTGRRFDVSRYVPDIGFEVHAQLVTRTKLFCSCPNEVGGEPNTRVCPVCLGLPGALPVLNASALDLAILTALAVGGGMADVTRFARKNYFYPDLPKGYQITQYARPVATGGRFEPPGGPPVRIRRVHLEEDAGKTVHGPPGSPSLVDMNRSGVPLVEIVTEPDIHSVEAAGDFLKALSRALVFLGVATGRMHEGSIRFDTNVSLRTPDADGRGTQTEIKNLNSFRAVSRALVFEIERQTDVLERGGRVRHATLAWDEAQDRAVAMRSKEEESDYRYFPDPDLGPFQLAPERVERLRSHMPELPARAAERLRTAHCLTDEQIEVIAADPHVLSLFDRAARALDRPDAGAVLANWVVGPVIALAHERGVGLEELPEALLTPGKLAAVVRARYDGVVSEPAARVLLKAAAESSESVDELIERLGLTGVDDDDLRRTVERIVESHPEEAARWRAGERKLLKHFVGLVMRETGGRADPRRAAELLESALEAG
ncbi:MAG: Asp-tRNA(Asn)/Glu-tRNA(Gln) amidotransferase subunit GatB [Candidatus Eisenbacteria bacterium]|nr:Asp-tRNA(Asn)/Glu-tRNA(Gln) amidotransferase subunit GatB [Candidatus Eisenbacteria bacterium]